MSGTPAAAADRAPGIAAQEIPGSPRIASSPGVVELYFPPRRSPGVAIPLGLFGAIAAILPGVTVAALLPSVLANAGHLLAAVLIASFVLPFVAFGVVLALVAVYMFCNALHVRIDAAGIETTRFIFGAVVKRRRVERSAVEVIEAHIPARYQSLFRGEPAYHLYARTRDGRRTVVAETLRGEAEMQRVKALIEGPGAAGGAAAAAGGNP